MVEVTRVLPGMGLLTLVAVVMHGNVVEQVEVPSVAIADDDFVPCEWYELGSESNTCRVPIALIPTGLVATVHSLAADRSVYW